MMRMVLTALPRIRNSPKTCMTMGTEKNIPEDVQNFDTLPETNVAPENGWLEY